MTVEPPSASALYTAPSNERVVTKALGQQDFLKLLITELANQNPLKPSDGADMMNQMTQMASIQAMTSMQENLALLRTDQQLNLGQSLINKTIEVVDIDGSTVTGVVDKVFLTDGVVYFIIGGKEYPLASLLSILPTPAEPPPAANPPPADSPPSDPPPSDPPPA